ncbi:MAG: DUF547 domain-containing protein [Acidobacteria bacterium]|nr:DUF547 domain-containing protein [Acidobacteriota bacterium]MCZ6726345.1 DUF547 domain-containing protein [Acidobacteriota bacterium]
MRTRRNIQRVLLALALCLSAVPEAAIATADRTDLWDDLLRAHVRDGGIDYAALASEKDVLDAYLESVATADVEEMDDANRLAFWINAYNAGVAGFVLERYPAIGSVRDVDGFFDGLTFVVAGSELTLDEVEGRARDSGDPRVHFAVVCASTSCPDLRGEAFVGPRLDEQLEDQTSRFLADPTKGLRFDEEAEDLYLSSIFKWYAGDFTGGSTVIAFFARSKVTQWVLPHLPPDLAARLRFVEPSVRYLDYDWSLNDR